MNGQMEFIFQEKNEHIATLTLSRGKVNALNDAMVDELRANLIALENDQETRAIILTGSGKFFSFGFDVPEFLSFSKERFTDYLTNFTDLYTYIFLYPKPVVAALNGHTVAGGCMLALACDHRVMISGKARISLNEIVFGSSVFAGSTEMLKFCAGSANATKILYTGDMYSANDALSLGIVNDVATEENIVSLSRQIAARIAEKPADAFAGIKALLRGAISKEFIGREKQSIKDFVDIWYSEGTWKNLQNIKIF
jgi:Delta3-Delta2-enoyl-CoA isomerase